MPQGAAGFFLPRFFDVSMSACWRAIESRRQGATFHRLMKEGMWT